MHIKIIWVGKTRNLPIRTLSADYLERIRRLVACDVLETRDISKARGLRGADLLRAEGIEILRLLPEDGRTVILAESGTQLTSIEFARWFENEQNHGTREVTFVIGSPEGLSAQVAGRAHLKLSLGKMTWTHEMCRTLLLEQIYRAYSILRKVPYHK